MHSSGTISTHAAAVSSTFLASSSATAPDATKSGSTALSASRPQRATSSSSVRPPHPTIVVRREALDAAGGYRDCGWPEDYDLVLRLWARGARFRNVDQLVLRWREHGERASRMGEAYTLDAFVRCKVHHLRASLLGDAMPVVIWGAGPVGKAFAREFIRSGTSVAAFVDVDPRKIGHEVAGAPVVAVADAPRFADAFAIGAVSGVEGRSRVRELAADQGRTDGINFVAVA